MLTQVTPDVISTNTISGLISQGFTSVNVATVGTQTIEFGSSNTLVFQANTSLERMRFDTSGNLGLGVTSPGNRLHVKPASGNMVARFEGATSAQSAYIFAGSGTQGISNSDGTYGWFVDINATNVKAFTNNTERMRIDSSGQIGIGGTPTASVTLDISKVVGIGQSTAYGIWSRGSAAPTTTNSVSNYVSTISTSANGGTPYTITTLVGFRALQGTINADSTATNQYGFFADAGLTGATNNFGFYSNIASGTGRWNFYANGTAANYFAGQVQLGAGSAGTPALGAFGDTNTGMFFPAADTIAFAEGGTESMRIAADGNVGIGTTSPTRKLTINGAGAFSASTGAAIRFDNSTTSRFALIDCDNSQFLNIWNGDSGAGAIRFLYGSGAGTEAMRIDASGNIGIGTNSPQMRVDVSGGVRVQSITNPSSGSGMELAYDGTQGIIQAYSNRATLASVPVYLVTGQLKFPPTQNPSSDANTLDDYEEGTWTPVLSRDGTAPSISYAVREGRYTKIGNMVTCWISINSITVSSAGTGNNVVTGLPFAIRNSTYGGTGGFGYNDAFVNTVYGVMMTGNQTQIYFRNGTRSSGNDNGGWANGGYLGLTFSYLTD